MISHLDMCVDLERSASSQSPAASPSASIDSRDPADVTRRLQALALSSQRHSHNVVPHNLTSPRAVSREVTMKKRTDDKDVGYIHERCSNPDEFSRNREPVAGRTLRTTDAEVERLLAAARTHVIRSPATGRAHKKPSHFELKLGTVVPPLNLQSLSDHSPIE